MGQVVVDRRWARNGDTPQAGAFGGEGTMLGIFEGNRFVPSDAELFDHGAIEIGRRFSGGDVLNAADAVERGNQAETGKVTFDVRVAGVGRQSDFQS